MNPSQIFTRNFLKLYNASGVKSATALMELINLRAGKKIIDNSYISKMLKTAKEGELLNPSIDKVEAIAIGFGLTINEMVSDTSTNSGSEIDVRALETAYRHTESFCQSANTDNSEFKARALKIQYEAILHGDDNLTFKMVQLAKEFGI